jgi:hypothetical protein
LSNVVVKLIGSELRVRLSAYSLVFTVRKPSSSHDFPVDFGSAIKTFTKFDSKTKVRGTIGYRPAQVGKLPYDQIKFDTHCVGMTILYATHYVLEGGFKQELLLERQVETLEWATQRSLAEEDLTWKGLLNLGLLMCYHSKFRKEDRKLEPHRAPQLTPAEALQV